MKSAMVILIALTGVMFILGVQVGKLAEHNKDLTTLPKPSPAVYQSGAGFSCTMRGDEVTMSVLKSQQISRISLSFR